jgi:hypothetical protein
MMGNISLPVLEHFYVKKFGKKNFQQTVGPNERDQRMMRREQNSNEAVCMALLSSLLRRITWRNLMTCACPGRQIRHHLFIADLLVWLLIILAILFVFSLV